MVLGIFSLNKDILPQKKEGVKSSPSLMFLII